MNLGEILRPPRNLKEALLKPLLPTYNSDKAMRWRDPGQLLNGVSDQTIDSYAIPVLLAVAGAFTGGATWAGMAAAGASAGAGAAASNSAKSAQARAGNEQAAEGFADRGSKMGTGYQPVANEFMKKSGGEETKVGQAFKELMSPGPTDTAADPAIMQATPTPDAPPPTQPTYADANLQAQSEALGTASADPAVADAAAAASTGGTPAAGMNLASIMPYVNMAAQVGGAISNSYPPQPVALHLGHMGGYQSTVPDIVERLRQALAAQRRR